MPSCDKALLDAHKMSRLMILRGWLRKDLAVAARVSPTRISSAFNGKPVGPRTAMKIADALGTTIAELIMKTPEN